jgi:hypothetical protein
MSGRSPARSGKDIFIAELKAFHRECGEPSFAELAALSEQLASSAAEQQATGQREQSDVPFPVAILSVSAVSEILGNKRKGLPGFTWVATFVRCCQQWAYSHGAKADDPGISSLPGWAQRRAECAAMSDGDGTAERAPVTRRGPAQSCPVLLPPPQRKFVASHGPHGQLLVRYAHEGRPEAVYHVALLLGTDPAFQGDALGLLLQAAAAEYQPAQDLLDANAARLPQFEVARQLHHLAQTAEARGSADEARAFRLAAARGGVPGAAPPDRATRRTPPAAG